MPQTAEPLALATRSSRYGHLGEDPVFLLIRAGAIGRTRGNAALEELGLRTREYSVLCIALTQEPTQKELADLLVLNPSQVVALVDGLEERGLVRRVASPHDRRAKIVSVTNAGRRTHTRAQALLDAQNEELLAPLSAQERETLLRVLPHLAFPLEFPDS